MIEVWYDNINPFEGVSTVPIISKNNEMISYNSRWGQQATFQIAGLLTGCNFDALLSGQNQILDSFARDFKSLQIRKDGNPLFDWEYAKIESISFDRNDYSYNIPFTINVTCFEENLFTGQFGIINPQNVFEFTQRDDGTIEIVHTISCNGFNTSSNATNALINAKDYVHSLSGWNYEVLPHFINYCSGESGFLPLLKGQEEKINRWDASYQLIERYVFDPSQQSGIYRYTTTFNSGIRDDFSTVSIEGSLEGGRNMSMEQLREVYYNMDLFSPAAETYMLFAETGYLNDAYLSSGVEEDAKKRTIGFNVIFTDDRRPNTYLDYSVSSSYSLEDKRNSVRINGEIKSRLPLSQRYEAVKNYYQTGIDIFALVINNIDPNIVLNPNPLSKSYTENKFRGEISFSRSYDDRPIAPSGLDEFEYKVQVTPSIKQYSSAPILEGAGEWIIHYLGYRNRLKLNFDGNAVISSGTTPSNGINIIKAQINNQRKYYMQQLGYVGRLVLDDQEITKRARSNERNIDFGFAWSFEANEFTI